MSDSREYSFFEFFAGGGMARAGLGQHWRCAFANDFDPKKAASYIENWGDDHLVVDDVRKIRACQLPSGADLAWASFPCQDLSLAGNGAGLGSERSGAFWPFCKLMSDLQAESRAPKVILLENVCGALTSNGGEDFNAICDALVSIGYRVGAVVINATDFVPQSRTRLFIIAISKDLYIPTDLTDTWANSCWHPASMLKAYQKMQRATSQSWVWWQLPPPPGRTKTLADLIEDEPQGVKWRTEDETRFLLEMMSVQNRRKVSNAMNTGRLMVGGVYRRTRAGVQRAEVRFDDIAGCLRTPSGGSSRQLLLVVKGQKVSSRLLSPREAARLMGLSDNYSLPKNYNAAYHLAGDGVVVPVVRFLAQQILEPIIIANTECQREVA